MHRKEAAGRPSRPSVVEEQGAWGAARSLGLPAVGRGAKDPPVEASEETWHRQHLDLRLLDSRISKYLLFEATQFATALVNQHGGEEA